LNAPDDDLEKPLPGPDALLDALVEVETDATPRRRTSKTLIAALVLSGLGIWQIIHVSNGGEPIFQFALKPKAAPTKQRSEGRESIGRVLPSTDPIAAYLERAKRGMTDREIRWMIEDFQTAGLDEKERCLTGAFRAKQQAWYLEALTEALQLSPEQRDQAKTRMDELHAADVEMIDKEVEKYPASKDNPDLWMAIENRSSGGSASWLSGNGYAPWNLCELTKEQSALTMRKWVTSPNGEPLPTDDPFGGSQETMRWLETKTVIIQDPFTGKLTEFPDPYKDTITAVISSDRFYGILPISNLFPLIPDQKLADHRGNFLSQARLLQPAQLRIALLLNDKLALEILGLPDQSSKPVVPDSFRKPADELLPNRVNPETPVDPLLERDSK
jgi:hypothetical protein